ncbi:MAG: hypothetical protein ABFS02_00245 [Pseudomonadota bacterium]
MTKKNKTHIAAMAVIVMLSVSTSAFAFGEADGKWFKVKYKTTNGRRVDLTTGEVTKGKSKGTCYIGLTHVPDVDPINPGGYDGIIVCQSSSGVWAQTPEVFTLSELPGSEAAFGQDALVSVDDVRMAFTNPSDHVVSGFGSHLLTIKTDAGGNFKKGKFFTLGGSLDDESTLDGGVTTMIGGYVVQGTSIPDRKLPFDPNLV